MICKSFDLNHSQVLCAAMDHNCVNGRGKVTEVSTAKLQSIHHCGKYRLITTGYNDMHHHAIPTSWWRMSSWQQWRD